MKTTKLDRKPSDKRVINRASTKTTKKTDKKIDIKKFMLEKKNSAQSTFYNIKKRVSQPRKKAKKSTKAQREIAKKERNRAILGIGLLLVVVSIAYSTSVIYIGVDSSASRIALLPQVTFALFTLFRAFSKLYK